MIKVNLIKLVITLFAILSYHSLMFNFFAFNCVYSIDESFNGKTHDHLLSYNGYVIKPIVFTANDSNTSNPAINNSNTFSAIGALSTVLYPNNSNVIQQNFSDLSSIFSNDFEANGVKNLTLSLYNVPKLVSGDWILNVSRGFVTNFDMNFKLLSVDGLDKHFLDINNFQNTNASIVFDPFSNTTINGFVDVKIDDYLLDSHIPIDIKINKINTIEISIKNAILEDLLFHNKIYGMTESLKNYKDNDILIIG